MTSKRKRDNDSIISIDSDSDIMDDSSRPRITKTSPRARQLSDPDQLGPMWNRLGMLQLDGSSEDYHPSAGLGITSNSPPNSLYKFSRGDFVADDEFDEDAIDIARLVRSARLSQARRDVMTSKNFRTFDLVDMSDYSSSSISDPETVEDTERDRDDYMTDDELKRYLAQLNLGRTPPTSASRAASPQRKEIGSFAFGGSTVRPGKTVELLDGDFIRVKRILQESDGRILLSGWRYRRNSHMNSHSFLPRKVNELINIVILTAAEFYRGVRAKEVKVAATEIKTIRRLTLTNRPYSDYNIKTFTDLKFVSHEHARAEGPLFSRWKYIKVEEAGERGARAKNSHETVLSLLRREEADKGYDADPTYLRELWRGPNSPGGSFKTPPPKRAGTQSDAIELDRDGEEQADTGLSQYEYGDAFCGCGGMSCGVRNVPGNHIKMKWGVDMNKHAIQSYALNFSNDVSGAAAHYCPANLFLCESEEELRVDILHASPPCKMLPCLNFSSNISQVSHSPHVIPLLPQSRTRSTRTHSSPCGSSFVAVNPESSQWKRPAAC